MLHCCLYVLPKTFAVVPISDLSKAMIFVRDNVFLEEPLTHAHVKPRLLGHWGTCPGIILVWSHLNLLIRNHDTDMIFVVGPGHGAPAALAALWIEGSLAKFYPGKYDLNQTGLRNLISKFSLPGGFPRYEYQQTKIGHQIDANTGLVTSILNTLAPSTKAASLDMGLGSPLAQSWISQILWWLASLGTAKQRQDRLRRKCPGHIKESTVIRVLIGFYLSVPGMQSSSLTRKSPAQSYPSCTSMASR